MIRMRVPRNIQYNAPITPIMSAFKFGMRGKTLTAASASREGPKKASVCSESIYLGALESRDCRPHCSYWSQLYFALRQKVRSCSRLTLLQFIVLVLALSLSLYFSPSGTVSTSWFYSPITPHDRLVHQATAGRFHIRTFHQLTYAMGAVCCCLSEPVDYTAEVNLYHFDLHRAVGKGAFGKVSTVLSFVAPLSNPDYACFRSESWSTSL